MAVTRDTVGTEQAFSSTATVSYTGLTISAGLTNSAAVFAVVFGSLGSINPTFSSVTWNGSATGVSQIINAPGFTTGQDAIVLFGVVNPASGSHTFAFTSSVSAAEFYVYGVSFQGVNQTGGTTTFAHSASAHAGSSGATSQALTLTTANGNWTLVAAAVGTGNGTSTIQLSSVATQDWIDSTDPVSAGIIGAAGNHSSSGTTAAWLASNNVTLDIVNIAGVDIVAAAAAAPTFGWGTGKDADRSKPIVFQADESKQFFRPSQIPVPTVFWTPPISDREKLPPIQRSPDEPRLNTYFIRSPNPVPQVWLPTTGMEDRPPEPKKRPDDSSIEYQQWFVRSPSPVPARWLPLTGEEDRPPNQNRVPSPDTFPWFVQSPNPVPRTWLPLTGEEDRPPHPNRILAPDQPFPFFVRSPNPVPARWLPTTGEEDRPKRIDLDPSGSVFVRQPITPVGISGIAWYNPGEDLGERPPPIWPKPINRFFSVQISTSTIAGMAWNNPAEDRERLPPIRRSPDEGTPFFVRSPSPVPIIWLPQWDGGEHPRRLDLDPSQTVFVRFPVAAAVPISGIAWYNPGEDIGERPPPVWPRPSNKFFSVQIQTSVPISGMAWYAPYADRERPPRALPDASLTAFSFKAPIVVNTIAGIAWLNPPETRLPPSKGDPYAVQTLPFFIEPPLIPFYAAANADDFNPLKPLFSASDGSVLPFRFIATPVGISGISWWRPLEVLVGPSPPTAEFGTQWRISQPPPPVGIAGISWWRQTEVYVGPPPPQLDYMVSWNPQFIFTPTNLLLLRTLMGMGQ